MGYKSPRVAIVGGGAMGGLFGALLAKGGLAVTILDPWREHIGAIQREGVRIVGFNGGWTARVAATTDPAELTQADVVLFQCKGLANRAAAESVRHLFRGGTVAISFQNGLGNEETLAGVLGADNVLAGTTAQAAVVEAPGVIRNFGDLPSYIGELSAGLSARATDIAAAFTACGLSTKASADIFKDKWKKLLGNIGIAGTSGVTNLSSVAIVAVPELKEMVYRLVGEAASVARAIGIQLDDNETDEVLKRLITKVDGGTGGSKSSLQADLVNHRPTEIDQIYGAVSRRGREAGIPTPTIDTVIAIVKGLESHYLSKPGPG